MMANQFNDGYYRIVSPAYIGDDQLVGVPYLEPPSLPVSAGRADDLKLNMWQPTSSGDGTYKLGVYDSDQHGYPFIGARKEYYVVGTVQSEEGLKWRFLPQPQIGGDAFTIQLDGKPGFGWTVGGESGKEVILGMLPPPGSYLLPTQCFYILPF